MLSSCKSYGPEVFISENIKELRIKNDLLGPASFTGKILYIVASFIVYLGI